jgi:hypothetical protein
LVVRYTRDWCPHCRRGFEGFVHEVADELAAHVAREHPDPILLAAMWEVDALTPAAPAIAPYPRGYRAPPPLPEPDQDLFPTVCK